MTSWPKFLLALTPHLVDVARDLYKVTSGDVRESKAAIRRMRDRGYVLRDVEDEVDARIAAVRKGPGPAA